MPCRRPAARTGAPGSAIPISGVSPLPGLCAVPLRFAPDLIAVGSPPIVAHAAPTLPPDRPQSERPPHPVHWLAAAMPGALPPTGSPGVELPPLAPLSFLVRSIDSRAELSVR